MNRLGVELTSVSWRDGSLEVASHGYRTSCHRSSDSTTSGTSSPVVLSGVLRRPVGERPIGRASCGLGSSRTAPSFWCS